MLRKAAEEADSPEEESGLALTSGSFDRKNNYLLAGNSI